MGTIISGVMTYPQCLGKEHVHDLKSFHVQQDVASAFPLSTLCQSCGSQAVLSCKEHEWEHLAHGGSTVTTYDSDYQLHQFHMLGC